MPSPEQARLSASIYEQELWTALHQGTGLLAVLLAAVLAASTLAQPVPAQGCPRCGPIQWSGEV